MNKKPETSGERDDSKERELREAVFEPLRDFFRFKHGKKPFIPGVSPVPVSGRVFDETDMTTLADACMDFWLTAGRFAQEFERRLAKRVGGSHAVLANSGSSANLLAVSALTSDTLGDKRLKPGDEVITLAASFPTTVNPIVQNRLVPVFVDIRLPTYGIDVEMLEQAVSDKTKALIVAHTLGNPFDLDAVVRFAQRHGLWLIEDCCDALGSTYEGRPVGGFGDLATYSFYPAHHITMGEGGAVATSNARLKRLLESFRDWGRDCWCDPGKDNTCGKRFDWQLGDLPHGYDHKYTYSHLGYNLKVTDLQAAIGVSQLAKLDAFIETRKRNFQQLYTGLKRFEEFLILPEACPHADPAWFGLPITVREEAPFSREDLTHFLEADKIGTRLLFAGNITRQPSFKDVPYRVVGELADTDRVMRGSFWIGVYPGLSNEMIAYILERFEAFFAKRPVKI
ncbi:MAG: lipopolysaccharide biosynthesis protein RfbH [Elusimicrobia bacterium]|nr:lipopolysaccharide biosynthesis protein RfbH [Elusimicrobiota bacterium]